MFKNKAPGTLVLHFDDGTEVELNENIVQESADEYWKSQSINSIRATMLTRCPLCPKEDKTLCDAVESIYPIVALIDRYPSYQPVLIEYWESETKYLTIESTLQVGLEYLVRLSTFKYCEVTKKFSKFLSGIALFSENLEEIAEQIKKNVFWELKGDVKAYERKLKQLEQVFRITAENKINLFRILAKGDSFQNALLQSLLSLQLVTLGVDSRDSHEENIQNNRVIKIQQEHDNFFALFDKMEDSLIRQGQSMISISDWDEFTGKLKDHFRSEGQEFDSSNYPDKEIHHRKHKELLEYLSLFEQMRTAEGVLIDFKDLRLLRQSILDHIEVFDNEMIGYLH